MTAQDIASKLNAAGYRTKIWTSPRGGERVYVSRRLSKGPQDMGYYEISSEGDVTSCLTRARAAIRDIVGE